jgi:negative regulator of flagellin synthesis FlgM
MTNPIQGVTGTNNAETVNPSGTDKGGKNSPATGAAGGSAPTDSANVSQTRALLDNIGSVTGAVPTIDQAKVDALKQAVGSGQYQVDAKNVAQQLLDTEDSLGGGSNSGA